MEAKRKIGRPQTRWTGKAEEDFKTVGNEQLAYGCQR